MLKTAGAPQARRRSLKVAAATPQPVHAGGRRSKTPSRPSSSRPSATSGRPTSQAGRPRPVDRGAQTAQAVPAVAPEAARAEPGVARGAGDAELNPTRTAVQGPVS